MTPFLYLAAAALFLLLAVGLTFPTLRWSYKYDMWRGIVASLGFLVLAPAALVIWYFCMLLSNYDILTPLNQVEADFYGNRRQEQWDLLF